MLGGARAPDPLLGACLVMPRFARGRNFYGQCESRRCVKFMHTPFRVAYSWPLCANMTSSMKPEVIRYRNASGDVLSTADMVVQRRDGPRRLREIDDECRQGRPIHGGRR